MIFIDICGASKTVKNTGANEQCLYSPTIGYALAKGTQSFADIAAFKSKTAWDAAKQSKDIAVMFSVESSELAISEATFFESRTLKYRNKKARKGILFTHHLGLCSHSAISSYEGSEYNRVYEFTEDGNIKGVLQADGTVKGQLLSNFIVGQIEEPIIEGDPQKTTVELAYKNYKEFEDNGAIVEPDFDTEDYNGVFEIALAIVGIPTSTSLVVRAGSGCNGDIPTEGLVLADFKAYDASGVSLVLDSVTAGTGEDANLYTIVSTALTSGTISTEVVVQGDVMLEASGYSFSI